MAKRRLTLFIDSLASGGAQTQILRLASGLLPEWQVRVAWYNDTARFSQVPEGVEAVLLPRASRHDPQFARYLRRLVSARSTDLVHAWLPAPSLYATLAALVPRSAPVITAVRCSPSLFANDVTQGRLTLATSFLARATTSNSQDSIAWLNARGVPARKMHYIGNALAPQIADRVPSSQEARASLLAQLGLDPREPPIVSLGRFDAYKNQDGLVRALARVRDRGTIVPPLLLAGSQDDHARVSNVRRLADEMRLRVHIVPAVTDVSTLLEASRFSVLASRSEGTPNVVLEALGLGTLVVATRVGQVPELVQPGTGLLCAPDDDEALADALDRALNFSAAEAQQTGARARDDMLRRFSSDAIVGQYATLYDATLGNRG